MNEVLIHKGAVLSDHGLRTDNYLSNKVLGNEVVDNSHEKIVLYGRRWYILFIFAILACMQSAMWNFYSPIASVILYMYDGTDGKNAWTVDTVEWLENIAGIFFYVNGSILGRFTRYQRCKVYSMPKLFLVILLWYLSHCFISYKR